MGVLDMVAMEERVWVVKIGRGAAEDGDGNGGMWRWLAFSICVRGCLISA